MGPKEWCLGGYILRVRSFPREMGTSQRVCLETIDELTLCPFNSPSSLRLLQLQRCVLSVIRTTIGMLPSEAGLQPAPAYTIPLSGVTSLPRFPSRAGHANPPEIRSLSWAQTSKEVDKSVFGQVARHLSHRFGRVPNNNPCGTFRGYRSLRYHLFSSRNGESIQA